MNEKDLKTWSNFEQFWLDLCVDYWSPGRTDLTYGTFLPLHPDDDASMLYAVDLTIETPENILHAVEDLGRKYDRPIGFYITPSWKGDIDGFKAFLAQNDFQETHRMIPHILEDLNVADTIRESSFRIEASQDKTIVATIFHEVFGGDKSYAQFIVDFWDQMQSRSQKTQFFTAFAADGTPAGIASCNYDDTYSYMNCLAVRPPYRRQGLASHLAKARLDHLREKGLKNTFTTVAWKNTASLNTQAKIGYRKLVEASVWKPRNSQYFKAI